MQDTFWTPELWCEFLNQLRPEFQRLALYVEMEQFKQSKSPKREWEIIEYYHKPLSQSAERPILVKHGSGYWTEAKSGNPDYGIFSVRRLSDQSLWSVKENVKSAPSCKGRIIEGFTVVGTDMVVNFKEGSSIIQALQKLPQPILTTVDGVELQEDEFCWIVDKKFKLLEEPDRATEFSRDYYSNCFIFSIREAAEDYILNNRPVLSLNDVKEFFRQHPAFVFPTELEGYLTELVKEKIK